MALADKVAVMWDGSILQADDPDHAFTAAQIRRRSPVSSAVGTLIPVDVLRVENGKAQVRFGNVIAGRRLF